MKTYCRDILPCQEDYFFSPVRHKIDFAKIIIYACRLLLLDYDTDKEETNSSFKLVIDKMSRLFFYKNNKFFSVSFPFKTLIKDEKITEINTYSGKNVDFKNISSILSILDDEQFKLNPSPLDLYIDSTIIDATGIALLEEIFLFEPSYIRYDNDPEHENGKIHPLHHLDINYSPYGTYKIGLSKIIIETYFENLLNTNTDCSYLND